MSREVPPEPVPDKTKAQTAVLGGGISLRISRQRELIIRPGPRSEATQRSSALLQAAGVTVLASSPQIAAGGRWLLVVAEVAAARAVLKAEGLAWTEEPVLLIEGPRQTGLLAALGQKLWKQGIGICHSYLSATNNSQMVAVFQTTDDEAALHILLDQPEPTATERSRFSQPAPATLLAGNSVAAA